MSHRHDHRSAGLALAGGRRASRIPRLLAVGLTLSATVATLALAAGGGGAVGATAKSRGSGVVDGGTATIDMNTPPTSLDPQYGYTTESAEADWLAYTPLLTYAHKDGGAGTKIVPGLATSLPTVSANGLTYTFTLRSGLKFSNGDPVVASDFTYAIERLLRLNFGGDSFFLTSIKGAVTYFKKKASTISGITTDDATGKITVQLVAPYGAFEDVIAIPAAAPVPPTTPMTVLTQPPPGVGAYVIKDVVPTQSFELVKSPNFASFHLPGIPVGHLQTIKVTIVSNSTTEAEEVLDNQVDNFDTFDTIPASLISTIQSQAASRFVMEPSEATDYFFLNQSEPPFNNKLAREAVNYAVNRDAFVRLASGTITPDCYLRPPGIVGHPTAPCPYGSNKDSANLSQAKSLIKEAHLVGAPVTVWGETTSPVEQMVEYYAGVLKDIGLKVSTKFVTGSTYFPTISTKTSDPQTGWSAWEETFPNPINFYILVNGKEIQPVGNRDRSYVDDPHIQSELTKLGPVPASKLSTVTGQWTALTEYLAKQADELVIGYPDDPKFMSDRIDFKTAVYSEIYGNDWSTWELLKS